ncbi:hypothetical protein BBJ29_002607 [Phytophthora kernoviae]|uniref:B30.2/SPRY domain-containing protein n=1 Tax=Phytophthora kernoviae TaxID=325452 RepID=A0A3R7HBH7_9STRA|nr:hypothetical protein BBJ29_002607 [Phytophthora kernoviae]
MMASRTPGSTPLQRVATPFGYGSLHDDDEEPQADASPEGTSPNARQGFAHVEFPWGHAYVHADLVAAVPVFTFYALSKTEHIKFTLPFALTNTGAEMVEAVRHRLELASNVAVALVQTDSVKKHEIKPHLKLGESTIGAGPEHPVLVLQTPMVQFDKKKCSYYMMLQEDNTRAVQVAKGIGSVLGNCEVSCGIKYWEVKLQSARGGDGVFIGVAAADLALNSSILSRGIFWGISCATGHKFHETIEYYADPCKDGDVVGVLLDMEYGRLSFYVNGRNLGVAFCGIQAKRLCPVFSLTGIGDATKPQSTKPVTIETECLDPSTAKTFETKIADLERSNTALLLQVDEQATKFSNEQKKVLSKVAKEHEEIVLKLQQEIKTLAQDVDVLQKDVAKEHAAVKKAEEDLKTAVAKEHEALEKAEKEVKAAVAKVSTETARVSEIQKDVSVLEKDVAKERAAVTQAEAELKAALAKLAEETARVTALEKRSLSVEKHNKVLRKELDESTVVELTMAALLSSYYDEGLIWAELGLVYAQERLDEQSGTLRQVQDKLQDAKKTACEASSRFYADNLAATLDPILVDVHKTVNPIIADVRKAVNPHVAKYLPIVQSEVTKAKTQAVQWSQEALRRAKLARLEAIVLLEQNEHVAAHAQKVIDGVLIVLAVPLVWLQINLALRLVWWLFTSTLCVLTCGLCCGARKRGTKSKRKIAKKTPSGNLNATLPLNGAAKKSTTKTTTTTSQKRNKKGKH